jgi:hypothetical protein
MKRAKLRLGATDVCLPCELLLGEAFFRSSWTAQPNVLREHLIALATTSILHGINSSDVHALVPINSHCVEGTQVRESLTLKLQQLELRSLVMNLPYLGAITRVR